MFRSARIKLTCWYLLVIVMICILFSAAIYRGVDVELTNRFNNIEKQIYLLPRIMLRTQLRLKDWLNIRNILLNDLQVAKRRLLINLMFANGFIIVLSAIGGYFLAGKTLKPIEEMVKEQNRFVADASHELRTPLASLKTSTEVALRNKKTKLSEAREVLESNLEDAASLQLLSDRLLSLVQYQKGASNLVFEKVKIKDAVKNACKKIAPVAREKKIKIKMDIQDGSLKADRMGLQEMMTTIMDNSVKYTPIGGKVEVSSRTDVRKMIIKVSDTGIGIDKRYIPYIFDRFYRVDQSRSKSKTPGFGLGLSIAKRIVELHGGSIEVASIKGKGSVFTIKLPIKKS
jgi:OmpR-family two-component system manganese-sensing sensor histidine kinase